MRVKLATLMAGPDGVYAAGSVIEVNDAVGRQLIAGNGATRVDEPRARARRQTATAPAPEVATLPLQEAATAAADEQRADEACAAS